MSDVIYNETGIGDLKGKTPNYNFNIPYFDIATWHDYIEENFRNIDALFHYIYEIKQYKGKWENNTLYKVDDVLFINDDNSQYNTRLVKVLIEHITSDQSFDEFFNENQDKYKLMADASTAYNYARIAEEASIEATKTAEDVKSIENSIEEINNSLQNELNVTKINNINSKLYPFIVNNVKVATNSWISSNNVNKLSEIFKENYKYTTTIIAIPKILEISADKFYNGAITGSVVFTSDDAISGNFAPIAYFSGSYSTNDGPLLYCQIFCKEIPQKDTIIPTVMFYWKEIIDD